MNILIVDDNGAAADLLQELMTLEDHGARCAYDAGQALAAAAAERFDVALIDLALPDLPGIEVARRLRAAPDGGTLLLIAVSGFAASESESAGVFDHHLQKPIDFDELGRLLATHPRSASSSESKP